MNLFQIQKHAIYAKCNVTFTSEQCVCVCTCIYVHALESILQLSLVNRHIFPMHEGKHCKQI